MKKKQQLAENNAAAGTQFLKANATRDNIVVTETGLQYEVLKKSDQTAQPTRTDTVKVHYHGTYINGKVFDSYIERGRPAVFPVSGVIPGWTEALLKMHVGDQWKLYIPSALAYGEAGYGQAIEPNTTLIFEVELLEIEEK